MKKDVIPHLIDILLPKVWPFVLDGFAVNWEAHDKSEKDLYEEAKEMIPKVTKLLLSEKLLFPNGLQRAEVKHMLPFDEENGIYLMGKFDFLFKDSEVIILDGKATHNVKDDQLYFYSYLYELINGELPDKIGYIYYDTAEVKYIKFSVRKYNRLKKEINELVQAIDKKDFPAKPELNKCEACTLKSICSKKELNNATA